MISLTPPGVSTNFVLHQIVEDIVSASKEGMKTKSADGNTILLFLDLVGFIGDYPETSHALDILGHNSTCPCHLCSFKRYSGDPSSGSMYASCTTVHSCDSSFLRCGPRTLALRESVLSTTQAIAIGMKGTIESTKKSPLFAKYASLQKASKDKIPKTADGKPVLSPAFDPYRSSMVAPDHLLAGIAKNVLTTCFMLLPKESYQNLADKMICESLRSNQLVNQEKVFSRQQKGLFSTTLSGTFCILLVAVPVFREICYLIHKNSGNSQKGARQNSRYSFHFESEMFHEKAAVLLDMYSNLVARTYYFPTADIDGINAVMQFNESGGSSWQLSLQKEACRFLERCDFLCRTSAAARAQLDLSLIHI